MKHALLSFILTNDHSFARAIYPLTSDEQPFCLSTVSLFDLATREVYLCLICHQISGGLLPLLFTLTPKGGNFLWH